LPRARSGTVTHNRHKKVLSFTKGHATSRRTLYRRAHESMIHALNYSYAHRRERRGDLRRLWIIRINAAARAGGLTYGQFMNGLRKLDMAINRKMLSELAINDPTAFSKLLASVKTEG
jgi:large subunit ribosomal protein L20